MRKQPKRKDPAGVDRDGRTELHHAALEGDARMVAKLLAKGIGPDASDHDGWTPLHAAVHAWSLPCCEALLDAGAAVDARDANGNTPLSEAVFESKGRGDVIKLLRGRGADPFLENDHGISPLRLARTIGNVDVKQFFADLPRRGNPRHRSPKAGRRIKVKARSAGRRRSGAKVHWTDRHAELWGELVPASGQARTVQGELVRITGRLADEANRNGNINWDTGHELWCDYLEGVLATEATFSRAERKAIIEAVAAARDYKHPDTSGPGGPLYLLSEMAVRWCDAHPDPIPKARNPRLRR